LPAFSSFSAFLDRYSEDAIDNVAANPVINPTTKIKDEFFKVKVKPASAPVNSISASLMPKTIEPMKFTFSSSIKLKSSFSCLFSSNNIFLNISFSFSSRLFIRFS